jgi:Ca2+-binding EF-hand superfamily protein/tetratricopeptide (TPR) repeat protein
MDWNSQDVEQVFGDWDTDQGRRPATGSLTPAEFKRGLRKTGKGLSEEQLGAAMKAIDRNGDHMINYDEFVTVFRRANASRWLAKQVGAAVRKKIRKHQKNLEDVFLDFDTNGDSMLSRRELQRGLQTLNIHLSTKDMKRLMEVIDANGDDKINWREFLTVATRLGSQEGGSPKPRPQSTRRPGSRSVTRDRLSASARRLPPAQDNPEDSWVGRSARYRSNAAWANASGQPDMSPILAAGTVTRTVTSPSRLASPARLGPNRVDFTLTPQTHGRSPGLPPAQLGGEADDSRASLESEFDKAAHHSLPPAHPEPEPEPEEEAMDDERSIYRSSFRDDKEHLSVMVEKDDLEKMDLEEIASEVAEMRMMVQEVRESRREAVERAQRHLQFGLSLVNADPPKIDDAMKEYAEGLRLVDDMSVGEIKSMLTLHRVEWEAEYDTQLKSNGAAAFGMPTLGKPNLALEMLQRKARENGLRCGWQGTSEEERELAKKFGEAREHAAWLKRSGRYKSGDGSSTLSAREQVQRHYELGREHFDQDRYFEAHAFFDQALDMRLNDKGLARKIGKALLEAKNAMDQQEANRRDAEKHRVEGRQYHEQAAIEANRQSAGKLWRTAIEQYEKGLVLARQRVTAMPSLVVALEKDRKDAEMRKGIKQRPSLKRVASKIVDKTKQDVMTKTLAARRLLGDNDYAAAESKLENALDELGGHAKIYRSLSATSSRPSPRPAAAPTASSARTPSASPRWQPTKTPGKRGGRDGPVAARRRYDNSSGTEYDDDDDVQDTTDEFDSGDGHSQSDSSDSGRSDSEDDSDEDSEDTGEDDESDSEGSSSSSDEQSMGSSDSDDDDDDDDDSDDDSDTDDGKRSKKKRRRRRRKPDSGGMQLYTAAGVLSLAVVLVGIKVAW